MQVKELWVDAPAMAADMLTKGYEWTLLYGKPTNQPMHRYKVAPKCCSMTYNDVERK